MRRFLVLAACCTTVALFGCSGDTQFPDATGEGSVRAINAIKSAPQIAFLIEERSISSIDYKNASATVQYDDLSYTFNFETFLAGATEISRIASRQLDVVKDMSYTFVLTGQLDNPTVTVWEAPEAEFADGATNFEVQVGHLFETLGDVDAYLSDPADPLGANNKLGTLAFGEVLSATSLESGDYVLTLTAVGDTSTILFESGTWPLPAASALLFAAFEPDQRDVSPVAVRLFNLSSGGGSRIADANYAPTWRFFHTSLTGGDVDIYVDDPLTVPLVAGHAFGDITGDVDMPQGDVPLTYTAANNMGAILVDVDRTAIAGTRMFAYLIDNTAGTQSMVDYIPDLRPVETQAKLTIMNTVPGETGIDIYFLADDEILADALPVIGGFTAGFEPVAIIFGEESRTIYVTEAGDKTVELAGPVQLDMTFGDVAQIIIRENVDPTIVDVLIISLL